MNSSIHGFVQVVWKVIFGISTGQVMGYVEVARVARFPHYARMVSKAMGRSPEVRFDQYLQDIHYSSTKPRQVVGAAIIYEDKTHG